MLQIGLFCIQVETAARFLNNSKVQGSSLESRKSFLRKKGDAVVMSQVLSGKSILL